MFYGEDSSLYVQASSSACGVSLLGRPDGSDTGPLSVYLSCRLNLRLQQKRSNPAEAQNPEDKQKKHEKLSDDGRIIRVSYRGADETLVTSGEVFTPVRVFVCFLKTTELILMRLGGRIPQIKSE
ncbi:hypothetical protein F2P81_017737 [Scophthalmus maximus]|uniref:Uncharacterized protein n=1 Tax=Scophthalmus maximus TaxID=52904 RepID=A0A6A4S716_SCOMX|nr:hypothetical protein F2P81_017737 [Scophthalmus maximus]